ncbi:hypothetical protein LZ32DRAFT_606447 [Colletotrichum eremochloae]|nr:hypothetical protein LY78DRAFT_664413 [Colletotrichum sublineola]KAK2011430.1 hypothetical protein LZ32DRAFT_606447 [Colletotrichum eremochloae]
MHLKSVLFLALAALTAAELDKRAPTLAECCCCNGGPSVGCAVVLDCSRITTSDCFHTQCPFK